MRMRHSAEAARQGQQLAAAAKAVAHPRGHVVSQVRTTQQDIQPSAAKMVDISGVIVDIAFQTPTLSLHVEAAHADAHSLTPSRQNAC